MTARYIAIDWGSTNLRAWLYQGDHCLDSRQSEAGVTRLNGKSPAAVLAEVTTDWREEYASGNGRNGRQQCRLESCAIFIRSSPFLVYWRTINICWRQYLDYSRIMRLS